MRKYKYFIYIIMQCLIIYLFIVTWDNEIKASDFKLETVKSNYEDATKENEQQNVINRYKDYLSITQSVITIIAIIVGGIWTYHLFIRQRFSFPKINTAMFIESITIIERVHYVHVKIELTNVGHVIFKSSYAELRLRQISPIPDEVNDALKEGIDPVPENETEFEWPLIMKRVWKWDKGDFEIEPGESDTLHADFIFNIDIKVAQFYLYISNSKKKSIIGWPQTQIHQFNEGGRILMTNGKTKVTKQQRQQKQQKPQQQQKPRQQQKPKKP